MRRKRSWQGQYVSASVGEALALTVRTGVDKLPHERLSDREYEVLCLIASGQTVSDIAESIHLSVTTISTYRARILDKMSLKNNAELTRYAPQHGLVVTVREVHESVVPTMTISVVVLVTQK